MGSSARSPRYRWKEGRETDLREYVEGRVKEGASITQALKEYGDKNRMSWLTARWKYYQVRNQEAPVRADERIAVPRSREDDFLGYLQDLVRATEESGQDIVPFIKGLSRMAVLSKESTRLREDSAVIRERLSTTRAQLSEHCGHLSEWLKRTQVDRVSCLKEFSETMERDLSALEGLCETLADA